MTITATQTPTEIDTQLADLYREMGAARNREESAYSQLHHAAGDKKRYYGRSKTGHWTMTDQQALETVQAANTAGTLTAWNQRSAQAALASVAAAEKEIARIREAMAPLEAEFAARRWSRFFEVQNNNGHIHSSMSCSTTYPTTRFGWHPQLSGLTETEAVADLGPILCSVCFPSAPVEWRRDRADVKREAAAANPKPAKAGPFVQLQLTDRRSWFGSETFKTQRSAQTELVRELAMHRGWGYRLHAEAVEQLTAALLAAGVTQDEIDAKVAAKIKRDGK